MTVENRNVFVSSLSKTTKRFSFYGYASITNISLLKLIYKYACYSKTYSNLQRLDSMVAYLQAVGPDIVTQITATKGYPSGVIQPIVINPQSRPTVSGTSITLDLEAYTFSISNFNVNYADADGDELSLFTIKSLPANGTLSYDGENISAPFTFTDASKLVYTRNSDVAYSSSFTFTVSDSNCTIPMESTPATVSITVEDIVEVIGNQPAVIGDRAQYAGNRVTTVFSVGDFTTQTIAPYFDPETNDLDAIRIDEVSTANTGTFFYLGVEVTPGQIITNAELAFGAFYHEGPDANSISTDSFNASVRDTGSMIWVQ